MIIYASSNIIRKVFFFLVSIIVFSFYINNNLYAWKTYSNDEDSEAAIYHTTPDNNSIFIRYAQWEFELRDFKLTLDSRPISKSDYINYDSKNQVQNYFELGIRFNIKNKIGFIRRDNIKPITSCPKNDFLKLTINHYNEKDELFHTSNLEEDVHAMTSHKDDDDNLFAEIYAPVSNEFLQNLDISHSISVDIEGCGWPEKNLFTISNLNYEIINWFKQFEFIPSDLIPNEKKVTEPDNSSSEENQNKDQSSDFKCTPDDKKMIGRIHCWEKWNHLEGLYLTSEDNKSRLSISYPEDSNKIQYYFEFARSIGLEYINKDKNIDNCSSNVEIYLNFKNKKGRTKIGYDIGEYVTKMGDYNDKDGSMILFDPPDNFLTDLSNSERLSIKVSNCGYGIANFNTTDFLHNFKLVNIPENLIPKIEIKKEKKNENDKKQKKTSSSNIVIDIIPLEELKDNVEFPYILERCDSLYQAMQFYWEKRYYDTRDISDLGVAELMEETSKTLRRNGFKGGEDKDTYIKILLAMDEGDETAREFIQSEDSICKKQYNQTMLF